MIGQTKEQTNYCLSFPSQHSKKATPEQEELVEKLRKEIEVNQENALSLCTEKVLLAQQGYDLVCASPVHGLVTQKHVFLVDCWSYYILIVS